MTKEPDNLTHVLLREIRGTQVEQSAKIDAVDAGVRHIEKQVEDLHLTVTYSLGQSTETQFRQQKQGAKIGELFEQLEKIMASEQPK